MPRCVLLCVCVCVLDAQTPLKSNEKILYYIGSVDQEEEIVGGRFGNRPELVTSLLLPGP